MPRLPGARTTGNFKFSKNVFNSLEKHEKESLLVKSGGEAFYEEIPEKKSFDDPKIKSFSKLSNLFLKRLATRLSIK